VLSIARGVSCRVTVSTIALAGIVNLFGKSAVQAGSELGLKAYLISFWEAVDSAVANDWRLFPIGDRLHDAHVGTSVRSFDQAYRQDHAR